MKRVEKTEAFGFEQQIKTLLLVGYLNHFCLKRRTSSGVSFFAAQIIALIACFISSYHARRFRRSLFAVV